MPGADVTPVRGQDQRAGQRLSSETTPATRMTSSNNPSVNVVAGRIPRG
jgi:hypothetical protein